MNGPVRTWYRVGTSVWPRSKAAQPVQPRSSRSRPWPPAAGRAVASAVRASSRSSSRLVLLSGQRPAAPQVPRPLGPHRPLDRPPEGLPVVQRRQAPGEIQAEELAGRRSGCGPGRRSRLMPSRARFWTRRLRGSGWRSRTPTRSIRLSRSSLVDRIRPDEDVGGLQVAVRQRPLVQRADQVAPARRSAGGSASGGRRPASAGRTSLT